MRIEFEPGTVLSPGLSTYKDAAHDLFLRPHCLVGETGIETKECI